MSHVLHLRLARNFDIRVADIFSPKTRVALVSPLPLSLSTSSLHNKWRDFAQSINVSVCRVERRRGERGEIRFLITDRVPDDDDGDDERTINDPTACGIAGRCRKWCIGEGISHLTFILIRGQAAHPGTCIAILLISMTTLMSTHKC